MPPDEDVWALPDYHPGPSREHLHALGVLALNYAKLQRDMDDLFLLSAERKRVPREWAETYYYALSEDKRSQAIKEMFKDAPPPSGLRSKAEPGAGGGSGPEIAEAIGNLVSVFEWCRDCRNNLLHAESYPVGLAPLPDGAFALTERVRKSSKPVHIVLTLRELRAVVDHVRDSVVQCARIHLFLRYAGQRPDDLPERYRKYARSLPPKLVVPRRMKLALSPKDLRTPNNEP
jgi:hypothetical protein